MGQKCCGCSGAKIVLGFQWLHSMAGAWNHESGLSSRSVWAQLWELCRQAQEGSSQLRWARAQRRWYSGKDLCCLYTLRKVLCVNILISSRSVIAWVWIIKNLLNCAKFPTKPKMTLKKFLFCVNSVSQILVGSHLTSFQRPGMIYFDWKGRLLIPTWMLFSECLYLIFAWQVFFQNFSSLEIPGNLDT